jgi:LPS O-antigen subunit length determinant protein (WzzB/FepE family)
MEYKSSNTEIDLLEAFAKFCSVILKNKILIITCTMLGLLSGYAFSSLKKPTWEAHLMVSTPLLSQEEAEFLLNELTASGSIQRSEASKSVLSLSPETRRAKDSENVFVQIAVKTDSKNIFPELQRDLMNYINDSEPVRRKTKEKKLYLSELINKITTELESLEKLKTKMANQANISTFSPSDLSIKSVELYNNKIQYQQALKDLDSMPFLVKGFEPVELRKSSNLFLAVGAGLGVFLAAFIILLKSFIPYYRQFVNKQS